MRSNNLLSVLIIISGFFLLAANFSWGDVYINEFLPVPSAVYSNEWIELYNNGTAAVNVTGWKINDSVAIIVTISTETMIQPKGYLLYNVSNKLNNPGDEIFLLDSQSNLVDNTSYNFNPGNDFSIGRFHDGWADFIVFASPTPNAANNRLPQGTIPNQIMEEDQLMMSLDLTAMITDADGDNLTFTIIAKNQSQVDCSINGSALELTPASDYFGSASCTVRADDTIGTADFTFSITVNPINDPPVISPVSDAEILQGTAYSLLLSVTDVDNPQNDLSVSLSASALPSGMTINISNPLQLLWTPAAVQMGVHAVSVVVTDGSNNSAPANFNLTVIPVLQIRNAIINGASYSSIPQVKPGDSVVVDFSFRNNYHQTLGHIDISAHAYNNLTDANIDGSFSDLPYLGLCQGSDCANGQWVLQPGDEAVHSFGFTIPYDLLGDFYVNLNVSDATIDPAVNFADLLRINFDLIKEEAGIKITAASLSDSTLTCTRNSDLVLTLVNTGQYAITPEILVYSQPVSGAVFDEQTGKFVFSSQPLISFDYTLGQILAGGTLQVTMHDLNLQSLPGPATLYIYAVNPYFNKSGFYVGDWTTVEITEVGSCLKKDVLEQLLTTYQDSGQIININLNEKDAYGSYRYLNEDKNYTFTFAVAAQTHPEIISCSPAFTSCGPPFPAKRGENEITLNITEGSSVIQESVKATVLPTLEISNVKVNLLDVDEGQATPAIRPLENYELSFTLTNHLEMAVTDLAYYLKDTHDLDGYNFVFDVSNDSYITAQGSKNYMIKGIIPADVSTGTYAVAVEAGGKYLKDDSLVEDSYGFLLNISQLIEGTYITGLSWNNNKSQAYCDQSLGLDIEYTNTGPHTEGDIYFTVKDSTEAINFSVGPLSLASGQTAVQLISFNTEKLGEGSHVLAVELNYNSGYSKDTKAASLVKHNCFNPPLVNMSEDDFAKTVDLKNYTLGNDLVAYALTAQSNSSLVQCILSSAGMLSCGIPAADATGTSVLNITLTAGTTINRETVQINVLPVNDPPVILLSDFSFMEDQYYEVEVSAAASDVDNILSSLLFSIQGAQNIFLQRTGDLLRFTATPDWHGQETFNLTVSDGINSTTKQLTATVVWNQTDDLAWISAKYPAADQELGLNKLLLMNVTISNPDQMPVRTEWFVNGVLKISGVDIYPFTANSTGQNLVRAKLFSGAQELNSVQWNINVIDRPADLALPGEILFSEAEEGQIVEYNFTVQNTGTAAALSNVRISSTASGRYEVKFYSEGSELVNFSLDAGESKEIMVRADVPAGENGGRIKIGDVVFSYDSKTKGVPLYLQVKSFLEISSVKLNGKTSGKFRLGEKNELGVRVENKGSSNLGDVEIFVTIKDIDDGDDWEDDSGRFDLDAGERRDKTFRLDVNRVDEKRYAVLIEVKSGSSLITSETRIFDVDLKKHDVVINKINFPEILTCSRNPIFHVEVENRGTSDEDEVRVSIRSDSLGITAEKGGISLDRFSGRDNSYRVGFALDMNNAENGVHTFDVEAYLDGDKLQDSREVSFTVGDCLTAYQSQGTTPAYAGSGSPADSWAGQIQQQMIQASGSGASAEQSFRDRCSYLVLLGVVAGLAAIFLILGLFALFRKH